MAVLSFFVCLGYTALNETARELEHPFGLGANHLSLCAYQRQFNSKLARVFACSEPRALLLPALWWSPVRLLSACPADGLRFARARVRTGATL